VTGAITGGTGIDTLNIIGNANTINTGENNDIITVSGIVSGVIDGGINTDDNDTLNITATGDRIIQLGTTASAGADYTVTNIELIDAATTTGNNTLRGTTDNNIWLVDADNDGDINGMAFRNFANLDGNIGTDTFTINADISSINTGNGTNSVIVNSSGNVTGAITGGTGIDTLNIIGNANTINTGENDDIITVSGTVSGVIDGGINTDDNDTLNITATGDRIIQLGTTASAGADYTVTNVELIDADTTTGNTLGNTLQAGTGANVWTVSDLNDGSVGGVNFTNFANLTGNSGVDTFNVNANISGVINGAGAADILTITSAGNQIVQLGATDLDAGENFTVTDVETVTVSNSATGNTLRADTGDNAWMVDTDNGGNITNSGTTVNFTNFANLEGNSLVDNFSVDAQINSINAGDGVNNITVGSAGRMTGSLITGSNDDTINIDGTVNTIAAGDGINTISVTGSATSITSGNGNDIYDISGNASSINAGDGTNTVTLTAMGSVSGALTTGTGIDIINIAGIVEGVINGGTGSGDILTITTAGDQLIQLGNTDSGTENFTVTNVETIDVANSATGNTLLADEGSNIWFINTDNNGTVQNTGATVAFSNVAHLVGHSGADTFNINAAITSINAGAGINSVIVNGSISGALMAGAGDDTITINAGGTATTINVGDGSNSITVAGVATSLTSGIGIDTITVMETGSVDTINAGDGNDTINISGSVTGVIDGGTGTTDLLTITTSAGDQVVQLGNAVVGDEDYTVTDIETIDATGTSGNVVGNTLIADVGPNSWIINGSNSGSVTDDTSATTTAFRHFSNLTGGSANDGFTISAPSGSIDGLINGMGGSDSLNITTLGNVTVQLGDTVNENLNVFQLEEITANGDYVNTLQGDSVPDVTNAVDYHWMITGTNSGAVTHNSATTTFTNFNNLYGGTAVDQFTVTTGSLNLINMGEGNDFFSISGGTIAIVDGNVGDDTFTLSGGTVTSLIGGDGTDFIVDTSPVVNITVGSDIGGFEGITAQNGNGTINAQADVLSDWVIDGTNAGNVSDDSGEDLAFSGFSTINGGSGVDNFTVEANGSISGTINGNDNDDTLTIDLVDNTIRTLSGQVNFVGGNGNDVVTIVGMPSIYSETYNPNVNGYDQLSYVNDNNTNVTFEVNYRETETVNDNIQTTNLTINSDGNADVISLGSNTFGTTGSVNVDYTGSKNNIVVQALNGSDVNLTDNVTVLGDLQITADEITQSDSTTITANSLTLDTVNQAGTSDDRLSTNVNALTVTNHSGAVFLDEQSDITLTEISSTAGNIDIVAGGSITSTADLQSGGTLNLDAMNNIDLSGQNQFSGATTFTAVDSIVLGGPNTFADTVDMTTAGNIAFAGNVVASSAMTLNAVNIGFTGQNQFSGPTIFTATDGILFNGSNTFSDTVNMTATNDIAFAGDIIASDLVTFKAANISLAGQNQFSETDFTATNDITLTGNTVFTDIVNMTAVNDIIFTEDVVAASPVTLNAGNNINLSGVDNQLSGDLTLSGSTININNTVATALAGVTAQNLTISSTGSITGKGAIVVQDGSTTGVATLTSTEGDIILDNENNNIDRLDLSAANDATVIESDGIIINAATVSGALNVTSNTGLAANDTAIGNMGLGNISAASINLDASEGAIVSQSSNLTADTITLTAASGIGDSAAINTTTATLSVINASFDEQDTISTGTTTGAVNINNTGNVTLNDLRNYGDITLTNSGDIALAVTSNSGAIDAHYGGDISDSTYAGDVTIEGTGSNNFSTQGTGTLSGNADIIGESLLVNNVSRFGTQASPIGLRVNDSFTLFANQGAVYYLGGRPGTVITTADLLQLAIRGFTGLSSQQLIEIETLGEIDQAIFTEVRNYNHDDVAILLPADQRYDDSNNDDEEDDKRSEDL